MSGHPQSTILVHGWAGFPCLGRARLGARFRAVRFDAEIGEIWHVSRERIHTYIRFCQRETAVANIIFSQLQLAVSKLHLRGLVANGIPRDDGKNNQLRRGFADQKAACGPVVSDTTSKSLPYFARN